MPSVGLPVVSGLGSILITLGPPGTAPVGAGTPITGAVGEGRLLLAGGVLSGVVCRGGMLLLHAATTHANMSVQVRCHLKTIVIINLVCVLIGGYQSFVRLNTHQ